MAITHWLNIHQQEQSQRHGLQGCDVENSQEMLACVRFLKLSLSNDFHHVVWIITRVIGHLCVWTFFAKCKHTRRLMVGVFQGSSKWTDSGLNFPLLFLINSKRRQWLFIDGWFIIFCLLDSCAPACARSNHKQTTNSVYTWHCVFYMPQG